MSDYKIALEDKRFDLEPRRRNLPRVEVGYDDYSDIDSNFLEKTVIISYSISLYNKVKELSPSDPLLKEIENETNKWNEKI